MKPSELIKKLQPFCKADAADEPEVFITTGGAITPTAPNTVGIGEVNGTECLLLFRGPVSKR